MNGQNKRYCQRRDRSENEIGLQSVPIRKTMGVSKRYPRAMSADGITALRAIAVDYSRSAEAAQAVADLCRELGGDSFGALEPSRCADQLRRDDVLKPALRALAGS